MSRLANWADVSPPNFNGALPVVTDFSAHTGNSATAGTPAASADGDEKLDRINAWEREAGRHALPPRRKLFLSYVLLLIVSVFLALAFSGMMGALFGVTRFYAVGLALVMQICAVFGAHSIACDLKAKRPPALFTLIFAVVTSLICAFVAYMRLHMYGAVVGGAWPWVTHFVLGTVSLLEVAVTATLADLCAKCEWEAYQPLAVWRRAQALRSDATESIECASATDRQKAATLTKVVDHHAQRARQELTNRHPGTVYEKHKRLQAQREEGVIRAFLNLIGADAEAQAAAEKPPTESPR